MNPINPLSDAFDNILEAGRKRIEANRLHQQAELLESVAQQQLERTEVHANLGVRMMGSVFILAHGGDADGTAIYLPFKDLNDDIQLMASPKVTGSIMPTYVRYQPALIIQLESHVAAALVVPYGAIPTFSRAITRNQSGSAAKSVASMLTHGIGFNPEMVTGVVAGVAETFERVHGDANTAIVLTLGGR